MRLDVSRTLRRSWDRVLRPGIWRRGMYDVHQNTVQTLPHVLELRVCVEGGSRRLENCSTASLAGISHNKGAHPYNRYKTAHLNPLRVTRVGSATDSSSVVSFVFGRFLALYLPHLRRPMYSRQCTPRCSLFIEARYASKHLLFCCPRHFGVMWIEKAHRLIKSQKCFQPLKVDDEGIR